MEDMKNAVEKYESSDGGKQRRKTAVKKISMKYEMI